MKLRLGHVTLPLSEFSLEVDFTLDSQVTAISGPSGAGKTSLLDIIAGLRRPKTAFIQLGDQVLNNTSERIHVPARHRQIGYVPQDLALFPHLSVRGNLLYGHRPSGDSASPGSKPGPAPGAKLFTYEHVTDVLAIESLGERSVHHLSGGEKQRVALARALLRSPQLLLLDEPLASLDRGLKTRILPYLKRVRDEFHLPMIYVTHDLDEIRPLCDEVLLMNRGRILHGTAPAL
jgi:molybdate transport system ATP-binding protein